MKMRILFILVSCSIIFSISDYFIRQNAIKSACSDESYPYIYADKSDLAEGKATFNLWLGSNKGNSCDVSIWISPAEANRDASNPLYWSLPQFKLGQQFLYEGSIKLNNKDIRPGNYIVELANRNGTVIENLDIEESLELNGLHSQQIKHNYQSIKLMKNNAKLPLLTELR